MLDCSYIGLEKSTADAPEAVEKGFATPFTGKGVLSATVKKGVENPFSLISRDLYAWRYESTKKPAALVRTPVWLDDFLATVGSHLIIRQLLAAGPLPQQRLGRGARRGGTFLRGLFRQLRGIWR